MSDPVVYASHNTVSFDFIAFYEMQMLQITKSYDLSRFST